MSLEQSIADLTTQAGLLLDLPQDIYDAANGRITAISNQYVSTIAKMSWTAYIDPINGSDDDNVIGSQANPLKTIKEAVDRTPYGGSVTIVLMGNCLIDQLIYCYGKTVIFLSDSSIRHVLSFNRLPLVTSVRELARFIAADAHIIFRNITLSMPVVDGYSTGTKTAASAMVGTIEQHRNNVKCTIASCDVNFPASPFGSIVGGTTVQLVAVSVTATGEPLAGNWVHGCASGAAPSTYPWLVTNLSTM